MRRLTVAALLAVTGLAAAAPGAEEPGPRYVRFIEREDGGGGLQTANATFVREADGVRVDLLSVVHIADADYFQRFNDIFGDYDRVLFELVGNPADLEAFQETGRKRGGFGLSAMQAAAANALELAYQMEEVDYGAANLLHADMDKAEFRERQDVRGQGFLQLYLKAVRMSMSDPRMSRSSVGLLDLAEAVISEDRPNRLKWLVAGQFNQAEDFLTALEEDEGTVIIGERNGVAMKVLRERIEDGDRKLAIFFGGGHMPDFEQRLIEQGFEPGERRWWTAWKLEATGDREAADASAGE